MVRVRRSMTVTALAALAVACSQRPKPMADGAPSTSVPAPSASAPAPPQRPAITEPIRSIAVGQYHLCALLEDKTVRCWGANDHGQLGSGVAEKERDVRVAVQPVLPPVVQIAVDYDASVALTEEGHVYAWGDINQLDGSRGDVLVPKRLVAYFGVKQISVGNELCALHRDGKVSGSLSGSGTWHWEPGSLDHVQKVACGMGNQCALRDDGSVWCWGDNRYGKVGPPPYTDTVRTTPVRIAGLGRARDIFDVYGCPCARLKDGSVWCWGNGAAWSSYRERHQFGLPPRSSDNLVRVHGPLEMKRVVFGTGHGCGLDEQDRVSCWGRNDSGQLGRGTSDPWIPHRAPNGGWGPADPPPSRPPELVPGLPPVREISTDRDLTCVLLREHDVLCWGASLASTRSPKEDVLSPTPFDPVEVAPSVSPR